MSEKIDPNDPAAEPKPPRYVTFRTMILTVLCTCILTGAIFIFCYDRFIASKVVVSDLPEQLLEVKTAASLGKITVTEADQLSERLIKEAKEAANSLPSNYLVILGDAILGDKKH